ncbi:hypothetical protein DW094_07285 [Ruminococcaceae bacterium AM07-15]|nr:hypothetical protein DW094_07285 [Ruminococcaceae bacterium AM07-15]
MYIYVDGIELHRNRSGMFKNISILVTIIVNEDGYREVFGSIDTMKGDQASH